MKKEKEKCVILRIWNFQENQIENSDPNSTVMEKINLIDRQIILIRKCSTICTQSVIETDRQTDTLTDRHTDR